MIGPHVHMGPIKIARWCSKWVGKSFSIQSLEVAGDRKSVCRLDTNPTIESLPTFQLSGHWNSIGKLKLKLNWVFLLDNLQPIQYQSWSTQTFKDIQSLPDWMQISICFSQISSLTWPEISTDCLPFWLLLLGEWSRAKCKTEIGLNLIWSAPSNDAPSNFTTTPFLRILRCLVTISKLICVLLTVSQGWSQPLHHPIRDFFAWTLLSQPYMKGNDSALTICLGFGVFRPPFHTQTKPNQTKPKP